MPRLRRRFVLVRPFMAELLEEEDEQPETPRWPALPVRGVECPRCDHRALMRLTDGSGTVQCQMEACQAEFDGDEIKDLPPVERVDNTHFPIVYYMRMSGLVKIGTSTNIRSRFDSIGPQGILAVEAGDRTVEHRRHQQFVDHHSHREWFHLNPDLVEHVAQLREAWLKETGQTVEQWLAEQGIRA